MNKFAKGAITAAAYVFGLIALIFMWIGAEYVIEGMVQFGVVDFVIAAMLSGSAMSKALHDIKKQRPIVRRRKKNVPTSAL